MITKEGYEMAITVTVMYLDVKDVAPASQINENLG